MNKEDIIIRALNDIITRESNRTLILANTGLKLISGKDLKKLLNRSLELQEAQIIEKIKSWNCYTMGHILDEDLENIKNGL